ncbi:putative Calpain catalytic domain-containing protein [Seiridium cardinale]|uniref:Calpain catalytic domain-containing protein n=1 Tax=Seiridium cardinale TaxID=138064 RepID=A0ABR2Y3B5_9PEZI
MSGSRLPQESPAVFTSNVRLSEGKLLWVLQARYFHTYAMEMKAREREAQVDRSTGQEALDHAIAAAELYMKAANATKDPSEKARLKKKINDLISRAERLKKTAKAGDRVSEVEKRLKLPRLARQLPTSEKNILLRGSKLHDNIFPPWEADPDPDDFEGPPFVDQARFPLSERQHEVFGGWKRPLDAGSFGKADVKDELVEQSLVEADEDYDLVQDITTDCSVVASLCASIKHLRPGPASILPALMFPIDPKNGQPKVSASGRYVFRMYFNGCFRKVVIDDRLPSSTNSRTLYVVDRQNSRLIWPALMEKAYLKVRGGYDFPGSNSGTDLWVLTGWIPQQLFLQSDDIDFNQTWSRVKKAYDYGDVVITLGTGRLSELEEETLGLAGEHDYAVLDLSETSGIRRMLVKNPWCDGLVWKGAGSSSTDPESHPTKLKPGSFWIDFDDVTQNFESLYLNWNPALFTERQDHHFVWQLPVPSMSDSFAHSPQYSMTAAASGSVWILLSRHFQDDELAIAKSRSTASNLADVSNRLGFMSLYIFDHSQGKRVPLGDKSLYRGHFVDSPQTLAPFEAKKGIQYTIAVAQHGLPLPKYSFTLSFFSRSALSIGQAADPLAHYTEAQGSWTRRTAGGNAASPSYLSNPQFAVTVTKPGPLSILLCTANEDLPVHIDLVWAKGQRVTALTVRDLVGSSGDYRRGCALAYVANVDASTYTVVCSTFEPGQLAEFTLRIGSMQPTFIAPVLSDAAGKLRTALGPLVFQGPDDVKQRASLTTSRVTKVSVVITPPGRYPVHSGVSTPKSTTLRLSIETGRGPNKQIIASTGDGEFRELGTAGLRTPEFDLDPNITRRGLWIVVEQIGGGSGQGGAMGGGLKVDVLSEGSVNVGAWESVDD